MIRALIVDDEAPARDRLRHLLAGSDVEVVGEAADGDEAIERIDRLAPVAVFLDIQMPGLSGLDVIARLTPPKPRVVFCTAFDRFAIDAFEHHAVDYLLKSVNRARLAKAIEKVRRGGAAEAPLDRVVRAGDTPIRFLARKGASYRVVNSREVLCFVSEEGITHLRAGGQQYWMPPTLNELEARLDPRHFFRISRAAIVNLDAVKELAPTAGGHGEVTLRDGTRLEVSRRRFRELTDRLGGS